MEKKKETAPFQPYQNAERIPTDPQGSYTGVPEELDEIPVQDVDDL